MYANRRNFCVLWEIGVEEHNGDVRFKSGSGNIAISRMRNEKLQYNPYLWSNWRNFPVLKEIGQYCVQTGSRDI